MKKIMAIATLSASFVYSQAQAADLSYNYVQAGLINMNVDVPIDQDIRASENFRGYNFKGSFGFGESFYVFGGYRDADKSFDVSAVSDGQYSRAEIGVSELNIGLGYHIEATENTDVLFEAEYVDDEVSGKLDGESASYSDNGYRIGIGLRGKASDKVELYGKINYSDVGKYLGDGVGGEVGAHIRINDTWGITVEYQIDNRESTDFSQFGLGVRARF